nr:hypothetical protein [Tanacetum cinerariifolium]
MKEVWFTICDEHKFFQESSNDDSNVVNMPQEPIVFNQDPGQNYSQSPPQIDHQCCYGCGDPLDDIFCQRCTYENSFSYDSTPNFVNDSLNVFNLPPQHPPYYYEFCRNDAQYGYDCPPQVPYNPEPRYNQDFNFPQNFLSLQQQYPCCDSCGGPHESFQSWLKQQKDQVVNLESYFPKPLQCRKIPLYYDDDADEERSTPLRDIIISELPPCIAITPVLSTKEPKDSLIIGDEHLDTIPEKESNEFIKSSIENLIPNPSESENKRQSEENYSNPLFDEEIISIKIDPHHFNAEPDLIESMLNQDSSIISSSKIDSLLDEFAGELIFLKSIPPGIDEADCDPEEEIRLIEKLLYDNSSPRSPKEINSENSDVVIESFSPSPIPFEDSEPFMEEIDLFLTSDGSIPPGIDSDYSDFEGDKNFLERLLHDDPIPLLVILDLSNVIQIPPSFFTYPLTSSILLSSRSEDKIFNPDIFDYHFSSFMPGVSH